jgi:micrococcal nuclease
MKRVLVLAALALLPGLCDAVELSGIVTEIQDGDTLTLATESGTYKIRLAYIDAPEKGQPHGNDSRASLIRMCGLKRATAEVTPGKDRNSRTLAVVKCAGADVNAEQVRIGAAWVFERYAPKNSPLFGVQAEARTARRGLWEAGQPVPPWEWRRWKRERAKE